MSLTRLIRPYFDRYHKKVALLEEDADNQQRQLLKRMTALAAPTLWGREHGYDGLRDYEDFARAVPVSTYEEMKGYIDRMRHGEADVLWPGRVRCFAKSSGTTNDKSKFLPVSRQALQDTHYAGGKDCVAYYFHEHPGSRMFDGKSLILGGSHEANYGKHDSLVGDLSAILIENILPLANLTRVPRKATALLSDFETKRDRIARETFRQNVTNLSGVPSWMLSVLNRVLEVSGKPCISDVWPNLEVFFHGGVAFTPYRDAYREIIPTDSMHYMETYNASEGFFALQTQPDDSAMQLMTHYGVFYEFIPLEEVGSACPEAVPLWGVECGRNYAMVISTTSGLWRYMIGDTVRFTSLAPYKIVITGRTKSFINAFGEELIVDNAEHGLAEACRATGAEISEYTAAPIFMDKNAKCCHQWLIEFSHAPESIGEFAQVLDESLQRINSDYEAKRSKNITLQPLEIIVARPHLFNDWLKAEGKLGGQHKVPRLSNDRKIIDKILQLNDVE
ncbi:MAG: GH3 auxin-responsive promoter family protein [Bacteroidaceae bacterium]|nr:GH3 auxin-responsive promoter family protein [Bacteroidaceae bacterium]